MTVTRRTSVPGPRLSGWLDRFAAAQGPLTVTATDAGLEAAAANGARAVLAAPWPEDGRPGRGPDDVARLAALAGQARTVGLVLVRRGGWAVGVAREGRLLRSKTGSRYVQGRTAAGGGSQQRYARRRANQADALVEAAASAAAALFAAAAAEDAAPQYVAAGGDRLLISQLRESRALQQWSRVPLLRPVEVQDPSMAALRRAAADSCSVAVTIHVPD